MSRTMYVTDISDMVDPLIFGSSVPAFHDPHASKFGLNGTSCKERILSLLYYTLPFHIISVASQRISTSCI